MFLLGFRRKWTALALCKSIESAISGFRYTIVVFAAIQNPAIYLSGAGVSIFPTLVPRLTCINGFQDVWMLLSESIFILAIDRSLVIKIKTFQIGK